MERRGFVSSALAAIGGLLFAGKVKADARPIKVGPDGQAWLVDGDGVCRDKLVVGGDHSIQTERTKTEALAVDRLDSEGDAFKISQSEGPDCAGIWLNKVKNAGTPCVAVYHSRTEGPVVGVHAKHMAGGLAACLHVDREGNGSLQLIDADGTTAHLTAKDVRRLLSLVK